MNALDMIVLLILLVALVRGLMRGLVNTVFSLAAWILAFIVGKWGALMVAPLLPLGTGGESLRYFAGFSVVFLVVLIVVLLLGHFLASAARQSDWVVPTRCWAARWVCSRAGDCSRVYAGCRADFAAAHRFLETGCVSGSLQTGGQRCCL